MFVSGESFEQNQPDDVNCKQFDNAVGKGPSTPSSTDDEANFCGGRFEQSTNFPFEEGNLYGEQVSSELPRGGIQHDDTLKRLARVAARPSRFRDDQFETEFRPGQRKYKVQRVGLDLEKGEPTAVREEQPQSVSKTPARQWCQALEKGEPSRI